MKDKTFERNSLILFVLMMAANVSNYLFQVYTGNILSVEEYAQVNTVIALIGEFGVFTTIVSMICARYIALCNSENNEDGVINCIILLLKVIIYIGSILTLFSLLFMNKIYELFGLNSKNYILGVVLITWANLFFAIMAGTLQGLQKFIPYGIGTIIVAIGKLLISIVLILIGWSVWGVIFGIFLGTICAISFSSVSLKRYLIKIVGVKNKSSLDLRSFFYYAFGAFIAQGGVIVLTNGDVLLLKVYFSDTDIGLYSSAMVIGKIAMYVSNAIVATLFPMVVEKYQRKENTIPLLKRALLYGGGISIGCAVCFLLFGEFIIKILFGTKYMSANQYLFAVCIYVVPLTFVTILMNYLLAVNKIILFDISLVIGIIMMIVISKFTHDTILQITGISGCVLVVVFIVNIMCLNVRQKLEKVKV